MAAKANTFEGGSDTTVITTANSGGASGDAFDAVTSNTANYAKFSTTQAFQGTKSGKFNGDVTEGLTCHADYWQPSTTTEVWARFYVYLTANDPVGTRLLESRTAADGVTGGLTLQSGGLLQLRDSAGAITAKVTTNAVPLNSWCRVEYRVKADGGTSSGEVEVWLYTDPNATSPAAGDNQLATGRVTGANVDRIRVGWPNGSNGTGIVWYCDGLAFSSAGKLGPLAAPGDRIIVVSSGLRLA